MAPEPTDKRVSLVEVPAQLVAAIRFSGDASYTQCCSMAARLLRIIEATPYEPADTTLLQTQPRPGGLGVILEGRRIVRVVPGRAGEGAGLRAGDEVATADGWAVESAADLSVRLRTAAGAPVALGITRQGRELTVAVELTADCRSGPGREGGWVVARYDPPMVPPPLRTNDVLVPLRDRAAPGAAARVVPAAASPPSSRPGSPAAEGVRASLVAAVRVGAPLYNAGDAAGCAAASRP
jgi:hypothetical protein